MPSRKAVYTTGGVITALVIILIIAVSVRRRPSPPPPSPAAQLEPVKGPLDLPKAPYWDSARQCLFFVDVYKSLIHKYVPSNNTLVTATVGSEAMAFIIPITGTADQFIVSYGSDLGIVQWDGLSNTSKYTKWAPIGANGEKVYRANEGKVSPSGSLFVGGHSPFKADNQTVEPKKASLYVFKKDKTSTVALRNVTVANGMAWNKNETMFYFVDSLEYTVSAYKYDKSTDKLTEGVVLLDFKEKSIPGVPDGMTIDSEDKLWIASFGGARILRFDPDTRTILQTVELDAKLITSVAFGGQDLANMYVTTGSYKLNNETIAKYPHSGYIFEQKNMPMLGRPRTPFQVEKK